MAERKDYVDFLYFIFRFIWVWWMFIMSDQAKTTHFKIDPCLRYWVDTNKWSFFVLILQRWPWHELWAFLIHSIGFDPRTLSLVRKIVSIFWSYLPSYFKILLCMSELLGRTDKQMQGQTDGASTITMPSFGCIITVLIPLKVILMHFALMTWHWSKDMRITAREVIWR